MIRGLKTCKRKSASSDFLTIGPRTPQKETKADNKCSVGLYSAAGPQIRWHIRPTIKPPDRIYADHIDEIVTARDDY